MLVKLTCYFFPNGLLQKSLPDNRFLINQRFLTFFFTPFEKYCYVNIRVVFLPPSIRLVINYLKHQWRWPGTSTLAWLWHHFHLALDGDQTHDLPMCAEYSITRPQLSPSTLEILLKYLSFYNRKLVTKKSKLTERIK